MPRLRPLTLLAASVAAVAVAAPAALGAVPNDPRFPDQWSLPAIGAPAAWDVTTGGAPGVRVAVIDSGITLDHPDLAPNLVGVNPGEMGGGREDNGVDDDGNGKVDDWRGWDFVDDDNAPDDTTGTRHGTHVAGIIAARGNNALGVSGVAWQAQIVPLKVLGSSGTGSGADAAAAIRYAAGLGVRIANASFGSAGLSSPVADAIAEAPNTLFVVAAGNGGDDGVGDDDDTTPFYPCALPLANVVCVAATDSTNNLASFSNRGATTVDLAAPGVGILGPNQPTGIQAYSAVSGTSFAAPLVTGVAALVLARNPAASTAQLRAALLDSAERLPSLAGKVATGGMLDAAAAVGAAPAVPTPVTPPPVITPAPTPVPEITAKKAAPKKASASVARSGARWTVTLRLGERSTARVVLERRTAATARRPARYVAARTVRTPKTLNAGIRRIALGAMRPGQYRLRIRVVGLRGATTIVRTFRVPSPLPRRGATAHVARGG